MRCHQRTTHFRGRVFSRHIVNAVGMVGGRAIGTEAVGSSGRLCENPEF